VVDAAVAAGKERAEPFCGGRRWGRTPRSGSSAMLTEGFTEVDAWRRSRPGWVSGAYRFPLTSFGNLVDNTLIRTESISVRNRQINGRQPRRNVRHIEVMDDAEIDRLRKEVHRRYAGMPHKKKYWLALIAMYGGGGEIGECGSAEPVGGISGGCGAFGSAFGGRWEA